LPPVLSWYVLSTRTPRDAKSLASVRWVMVAPTWAFTSSPMQGSPAWRNRSAQI